MNANMWNDILNTVLAYKNALIAGAGILLVFFVLWIVFRGLRLWYWKVDVNQRTLESIDQGINSLRTELNNARLGTPRTSSGEQAAAPVVYFAQPMTASFVQPVPVSVQQAPVMMAQPLVNVQSNGGETQTDQGGILAKEKSNEPNLSAGKLGEAGTFKKQGDPQGINQETVQRTAQNIPQGVASERPQAVGNGSSEQLLEELQNLGINSEQLTEKEEITDKSIRYTSRECGRDKTGRVYTREEIAANIRA